MKLRALIVLVSVVFVLPAYTYAAPDTTGTDNPYGKATLVPIFGQPNRIGLYGTALFYKVGDAADSTRVVVQLEGFKSGDQLTPGIAVGDCQGDGGQALNSLTIDQSGKGQSTTVLTDQQVPFGQWYVRVDFCDMLKPGQICALCGRVDQITSQNAGYTAGDARGNLPTTGSSFIEYLEFSLALAMSLFLLASGTYLRLSGTHRSSHD